MVFLDGSINALFVGKDGRAMFSGLISGSYIFNATRPPGYSAESQQYLSSYVLFAYH